VTFKHRFGLCLATVSTGMVWFMVWRILLNWNDAEHRQNPNIPPERLQQFTDAGGFFCDLLCLAGFGLSIVAMAYFWPSKFGAEKKAGVENVEQGSP
jgi:hypothetical protein